MASGATVAMTPQQQQYAADQQNIAVRNFLLANAQDMDQQISSKTISPASIPTVTEYPRPVGLVKRLMLEITATIVNTSNVALALNDLGLANLLTNVTFTDTANNVRINTTGAHLYLLASFKRRRSFGASYDCNTANGNSLSQQLNVAPATWPIYQAPSTIAANSQATVRTVIEVPLAYTSHDLRGSVFAGTINGTNTLDFTFNQNPIQPTTGDTTNAMYVGAAGAAGYISSATYTLTQNYLDQIPSINGQLALPAADISTVYELKQSGMTGIVAGTDFYIPFTNYKNYASEIVIFNSTGGAAGRNVGTDVTSWSLRAANSTNIFNRSALSQAMHARDNLMSDLPAGFYYFSQRENNLNTQVYGNMNLVLNASASQPGATVSILWEAFTYLSNLTAGQALANS